MGLKQLSLREPIDCGDAAAVLRFLALRASRVPGRHILFGSSRLMQRKHEPLVEILGQLKVRARLMSDNVVIEGDGWPSREIEIKVDRSYSSQFASAILLNSWKLENPVKINWTGKVVSDGYWQMSLRLAQKLGLAVSRCEDSVTIGVGGTPDLDWSLMEPDMSSAFAICGLAAVGGKCIIRSFPKESLQPDSIFVSVLEKLGVPVKWQGEDLVVERVEELKPISMDLSNCPDMFPVLSLICAFARGHSHLFGASHLAYKESNRIKKTAELVRLIGRDCTETLDGLIIRGQKQNSEYEALGGIIFDPDRDHRLVMAAGVAKAAGLNLVVRHPKVVHKSFPGYLEISPL